MQLLESDLKKVKSDAFHAKEDAKKSSELLVQAKGKIEATNKTVETLLKELNNVQGQLKLSNDEVNNLHQTLNRERMKSSTPIAQTLQTSGEDAEKLNLLSQVESFARELKSAKDQLVIMRKIQSEREMSSREDEPDDGPKTLVFDNRSQMSEQEVSIFLFQFPVTKISASADREGK